MDISKTIKENTKRNRELEREEKNYDPVLGIGSPIERFKFSILPNVTVNLPMEMKKEPLIKEALKAGSLLSLINKNLPNGDALFDIPEPDLLVFTKLRFKYDFEYWAYTTIKIKDKESALPIPLKLNAGQRKLLKSFEKQRLANKPIRTVLVKARQWGGSTETEFYGAWIQSEIKINWNSCIIGDVESQANTIRGMYSFATTMYPKELGTMALRPFEGSQKNRQMVKSGSVISIGSMQKPDSLRSQDLKIGHFSEVSSWKSTLTKKPKDLIQSIKSSIPFIPYTMIVEESTAKGVGNYFHKAYLRAKEGKSGYDLVFVGWHEIARNRIKFKNRNEKISFIKTMSDYDWWLWKQGATLEGINWYNIFKDTELGGDEWTMKAENPTTAEEAFQSTGQRVFKPQYTLKARMNCTEPVAKGSLSADGIEGRDALKNIEFNKGDKGSLWIWAFPDKSINVKNRYVVSLDIGGTTIKADWSYLRVIDKYWMLYDGVPETVASMKIHVDNDILAWYAVQIAEWYNHALLVVESNSLKKDQNVEGDGYLTILNEISDYYDNIYLSSQQDTSDPSIPVKYGFHTNSKSKPMIINHMKKALRDDGYIERDERVVQEYDTYEYKPDRSLGAVDGEHDDGCMSTSIGLWVALKDSDFPSIVDEMKVKENRERRKQRIKNLGEATF